METRYMGEVMRRVFGDVPPAIEVEQSKLTYKVPIGTATIIVDTVTCATRAISHAIAARPPVD